MSKVAVQKFGNHVPVLPVFTGIPTDADFVTTPPNGSLAVGHDAAANAGAGGDFLYVRIDGLWERVEVA